MLEIRFYMILIGTNPLLAVLLLCQVFACAAPPEIVWEDDAFH